MSQHVRDRESAVQMETLRGLFGDDDESIREILETYLDDLGKSREELAASVTARDRKRTGRIAHSMKGASANVGANGLSVICASLEHRSAEASWEELEGLAVRVRDEAVAVLASVRKELASMG